MFIAYIRHCSFVLVRVGETDLQGEGGEGDHSSQEPAPCTGHRLVYKQHLRLQPDGVRSFQATARVALLCRNRSLAIAPSPWLHSALMSPQVQGFWNQDLNSNQGIPRNESDKTPLWHVPTGSESVNVLGWMGWRERGRNGENKQAWLEFGSWNHY